MSNSLTLTLSQEDKEFFNNNGYLIIKEFFKLNEFDSIKIEIENEINELISKLYKKGLIKKDYSLDTNLNKDEKLKLAESDYVGSSILLHTKFASKLSKSFGEDLFSNLKLLDVIETLLESKELSGHPEWNLRSKTNSKYFNVPYHQDAAYLEIGSENYSQITVWITLVDIDQSNGPLQILPRSIKNQSLLNHKLQKTIDKSFNDSWYLEIDKNELISNNYLNNNNNNDDDDSGMIVTCSPLPAGSIVLFSNKTVHRSLPNLSNSIRWTIDIRFFKTNDPTGFNPIDQKDTENKMKLRSSTQSLIPIDYSIWSPQSNSILMSNNSTDDKNDDLSNYSIEGPWFNRWKDNSNNNN